VKSSEKLIKIDEQRKERKMRKQRSKNIRKYSNNKIKKHKLSNEDGVLFKAPNLKNIPPGCQKSTSTKFVN
jgi:hypothetical protein